MQSRPQFYFFSVDWLLAIFAGYEQGVSPHCRFVMKGELSILPYFGAVLHYHGCIFVRRGDFHQDLMLRSLARLNKLKLKVSFREKKSLLMVPQSK